MSFGQSPLGKSDYRPRRVSAWVLVVLYGVAITVLIGMIVANRTPVESPLVEIITQASCLSAETRDCQAPADNLNAPFFIGAFVAMAGILILFMRPWKPLTQRKTHYNHVSSAP